MKRFIASLCISLAVASACGQGIVNLDFEGARVVPVLTNNGVVFIDAADALPGWLAFDGTNLLTTIPYIDSIGLLIGLVSSNAALSGNFSVALGSGFNSISQTGLVPEGAESLLFEAYFIPAVARPTVVLGGQHLLLTTISRAVDSHGQSYTVYGANISAFAGQVETLTFFATGVLDQIQFSSTPVPEPSMFSLVCFGSGVLIYVTRRRHR